MTALHPLVERILENRKIKDKELFLNPLYDARHDPFLLTDMEKAVSRILAALEKGEKIAVWHDYDCDGIPGGALLYDFFRTIGHPIRTHVPERKDGYGLNEPGLRALNAEGISLVITVDCGITDIEEAQLAKELGMDLIVTDHHLPQNELPSAYAIVNPHRAGDAYPFKGLCGTGVAFKLAEALIARGSFNAPKGFEKWLLDLVALATVADMMPLTDENRALVRWGLTVIRKGRRPGLRALFEADGVPIVHATEDDLAFSVAPKINAASRMESPQLAFELLTTDSPARAGVLAKKLVSLNQARKTEGMRVAKDVKRRMEGLPAAGGIVIMGSRSWRPSLLGIAATSVVETYGKTVCLWGADGEFIKGSCRSNGDVNIVELMRQAKDAFLDFGGHEFSGGFSVSPDKVQELPEKLDRAFSLLLADKTSSPPVSSRDTTECSLTLSEVNDGAFDALRMLSPFGMENPKPVFRFPSVSVAALSYFGKMKEHVRLTVTDHSGFTSDAIAFFVSRTRFKETLALISVGDHCALEASVERSHFRGRTELRLRIQDLSLP